MNLLHSMRRLAAVLFLCFMSAACGGGGGGGSNFVGAANVGIDVSPDNIDQGDHTQVVVDVADVHPNGILLKLRFPDGLAYVKDSALLTVDGNDIDISPSVNVAKDGKKYVVFFLTESIFGDHNEGTVTLQLEGKAAVTDGQVEVDPDVNDPSVSDSKEFNIKNPQFEAADTASIKVRG